jgi:3-phenylpropionate/trans-cinnamate dioxygenase ferredoxin subunit
MQNNIPPKKAILKRILNKDICVVHGLDGFYAVQDKCPHNGFSLSKGYCSDVNSVVCPLHRYHFDLRSGRAKSGIGETLQTYPLKTENDGVYIGFEIKKPWSLF